MVKVEEVQADERLMDTFIQENMGLVRIAIKKLGLSVYDEDYIQEGCIGFIKAIKNYNTEFGTAFSTYAIPTIQSEIRRYRRDFETTSNTGAKVSRELMYIYFKSQKLRDNGIPDEEICARLDVSLEKLNKAHQAMQHCTYLDAELAENSKGEEGRSWYELIPSDFNLEEEATEKVFKAELFDQLFECLNEKWANILYLHLQGLTQTAIAQKAGISQARVARVLQNIIQKGRLIAERRIQVKMKITDQQLLAECRKHGTDDTALEKIAEKYGMTLGSVKYRMYNGKIKHILKSEKEKEKLPISAKEQSQATTSTVKKTERIKWYQDKYRTSLLKAKAWDGKECTYTFQDGKLVISNKDGVVPIEDYKTMLLEIQELLSIKEGA